MSRGSVNTPLMYTTRDGQGNFTYPLNGDNDEYYLRVNGEDVVLNSKYAKDSSKNEIYPKDALENDKPIESTYALIANGTPIFPKTKDGNEFYVKDSDGASVIELINGNLLPRYAKTKDNDEIYPIKLNFFEIPREIILNNAYAKLSNNQVFYPLDEFGNEYILEVLQTSSLDEKKVFPNSYPITNDNFVIVPNIQYKPYFLKTMIPKVEDKNILGKLYREENDYKDFLTNVKATRKSRSLGKEYMILPKGMWQPSVWVPDSVRGNKSSRKKPNSIQYSDWSIIFLFIILLAEAILLIFGLYKNKFFEINRSIQ